MGFIVPRHALQVYSQTGELPQTARWERLEARHDLNPARFDHYHPTLAGLFDKADCIGELPDSPFYDNLRDRYDLNPARFTKNHPFLGKLLERDHNARLLCECDDSITPPICEIPIIPPPIDCTPVTPPIDCTPVVCQPPGDCTNPCAAVPEPATIVSLAIGLFFVGLFGVKRKKARLVPA